MKKSILENALPVEHVGRDQDYMLSSQDVFLSLCL